MSRTISLGMVAVMVLAVLVAVPAIDSSEAADGYEAEYYCYGNTATFQHPISEAEPSWEYSKDGGEVVTSTERVLVVGVSDCDTLLVTQHLQGTSKTILVHCMHVMDDEDQKFDVVFHDGNDQIDTVTLDNRSWFKLGDIIAMAPQDPVKEGYKFGGWYTDPSYADGSEFDPRNPVEDDMDVYALWIADPSGDDDDAVITVPGTNTAHVVTFDTVFGLEYDVVSSSATSVTFTVSVVGGYELKDGTLKVDSNGGTITESNGTYTLSSIDRNIIVTITGEVSSILDPGGIDEPDEPKEPADDGGFPLWIVVVIVVIIVAIVAVIWYMRGRI